MLVVQQRRRVKYRCRDTVVNIRLQVMYLPREETQQMTAQW
jgi:hypothetical protein